jgi:hypothetical protein
MASCTYFIYSGFFFYIFTYWGFGFDGGAERKPFLKPPKPFSFAYFFYCYSRSLALAFAYYYMRLSIYCISFWISAISFYLA